MLKLEDIDRLLNANRLDRIGKGFPLPAPPQCPRCIDETDCGSVELCRAIHSTSRTET